MSNRTAFQLQTDTQFALFLRSLRRSQGLTQQDLGKRIGVTGSRISEIERNPSQVGLAQVLKLLHALGARAVLELNEGRLKSTATTSATLGEW